MKITIDRLRAAGACKSGMRLFTETYPDGMEPTVEALMEAASAGLDVHWAWNLLPSEGPGSRRAYALWCAEQAAHLCYDPRAAECLRVVRARVEDPASVTDAEMAAAWNAAWAAAGAAAWDAAWDAQIACLSQLLLEAA